MTTLTLTLSGPRPTVLRLVLDRLARAARAKPARHADLRLSDHLLRDLGLTRGDVDAI